jgi:hypothetical protein
MISNLALVPANLAAAEPFHSARADPLTLIFPFPRTSLFVGRNHGFTLGLEVVLGRGTFAPCPLSSMAVRAKSKSGFIRMRISHTIVHELFIEDIAGRPLVCYFGRSSAVVIQSRIKMCVNFARKATCRRESNCDALEKVPIQNLPVFLGSADFQRDERVDSGLAKTARLFRQVGTLLVRGQSNRVIPSLI